jgi:hypothetical protein
MMALMRLALRAAAAFTADLGQFLVGGIECR